MSEPQAESGEVTTTEWGIVIDSLGSVDYAESEVEARDWLAAGQGLSLVRVVVTEWPRVNALPDPEVITPSVVQPIERPGEVVTGGCCGDCGGTGSTGGELCWTCRATGHPHPSDVRCSPVVETP